MDVSATNIEQQTDWLQTIVITPMSSMSAELLWYDGLDQPKRSSSPEMSFDQITSMSSVSAELRWYDKLDQPSSTSSSSPEMSFDFIIPMSPVSAELFWYRIDKPRRPLPADVPVNCFNSRTRHTATTRWLDRLDHECNVGTQSTMHDDDHDGQRVKQV